MKHIAIFGVMALVSAPLPAQENQPEEAQMMREAWAKTDKPSIGVVQQVYSRTISIDLPRKFVTAYRQRSPAGYIVEYLPDGQTLANWTQMITITSNPGVGAAKAEDAAIAAYVFSRNNCPGKLFRDLGAMESTTSARARAVVIGCGTVGGGDYAGAVTGADERAAIAFLRDDENIWTVQFAERNLPGQSRPLFDVATAPAMLDKLGIRACTADDDYPACANDRTIAKMVNSK